MILKKYLRTFSTSHISDDRTMYESKFMMLHHSISQNHELQHTLLLSILWHIGVTLCRMTSVHKFNECLEVLQFVLPLTEGIVPAVRAWIALRTRTPHECIPFLPDRGASNSPLLVVHVTCPVSKHSSWPTSRARSHGSLCWLAARMHLRSRKKDRP
jgi:hypothetical protein